MKLVKKCSLAIILLVVGVTGSMAASVSMKISGPGVVNDTTIKAGEKVSVDIYIANDTVYTGFTLGFSITSPSIKSIIHVPDSNNGLNPNGDVKGHNGWEDASIWDFEGVFVSAKSDWDGQLPDLIGFGGVCFKNEYKPHDLMKVISFDMIVPDTGMITVDSSFFPPAGKWMFAGAPTGKTEEPKWGGPYNFR
ncbi:MAG: hypothetical protein ACE5K8_07590, partial [Candidatus Zixiibacteriota bacterium]